MKKIYLASPYSYKTPAGKSRNIKIIALLMQWIRFRRVTRAAAKLMVTHKVNIFSPITHSHPIAPHIPLHLDTHNTWLEMDFQWIDACDEIWVFCQPGWKDSYGIEQELLYATLHGIQIRWVDWKTLELGFPR